MISRFLWRIGLGAASIAGWTSPALAASPDRTQADTLWARCGAPVSVGAADRTDVLALSDGSGGLFAVWQRVNPASSHSDLWAQHLDANGAVAAGWDSIGLALSTAPGDQTDQAAILDGAGGLIVAWTDDRADSSGDANPDIYALRVGADGGVTAGWSVGGTPLTSSPRAQEHPSIASDGSSGAFVVWDQPAPAPSPGAEIAIQHVLGTGALAPGWPDSGVVIATGPETRGSPTVVSDGAGGALVAWDDTRDGNSDIYAQRVATDGSVLWAANGVRECAATRSLLTPRGVSDGAGGILLAIQELTLGDFNSVDLVAQRVDATGAQPAGWPSSGISVCSASGPQVNHRIATDAAGGAYVSWDDFRSGTSRSYVQRLRADGTLEPGWNLNGNSAGGDPLDQEDTDLAADGQGGTLVAWTEGGSSVFLQRLTAVGAPAAGWSGSGLSLCADHPQQTPAVTTDTQFGALVVSFDDRRSGIPELYASHVSQGALVPALLSLSSVSASVQSVRLAWFGAPAGAPAELWRMRAGEPWSLIARPLADGTGSIRYDDRDVAPGERLRYRLSLVGNATPPVETSVMVPGLPAFAIERVAPNPSSGRLTLAVSSPIAGAMRVELLDVAGRRVESTAFQAIAGENPVRIGDRRRLAPGVYTARAALGSAVATRRVCVVR